MQMLPAARYAWELPLFTHNSLFHTNTFFFFGVNTRVQMHNDVRECGKIAANKKKKTISRKLEQIHQICLNIMYSTPVDIYNSIYGGVCEPKSVFLSSSGLFLYSIYRFHAISGKQIADILISINRIPSEARAGKK